MSNGDVRCQICGNYNCNHWEIGLRTVAGFGKRCRVLPFADRKRLASTMDGLEDILASWHKMYDENLRLFAHDYYDEA